MKLKSLWLVGAASAAMILTASAAQAGSASANNSAATDQALAQANQRLDDVNSRLDALESELQSAETRAAADHDASTATANSILGAWWNNTSINGRMYWDFSYVDQEVNHTRTGTTNGTAFDIKRFYVGIDHKFNDVFSANVTTDFTFDSSSGVNQVFIKKAYLQAKVSDALVFKVGSTDMPWIPFMEDIYGYRYVENTLTDRLKDANSADWGAHVSGKLYDGMLNYAVSVVNGAGYKKANIFRTNGPDVEGRLDLDVDHFIVGIGGYTGKFGQQFGTALHHSFTRGDAVAAYVMPDFRIGVEYFAGNNVSSVTSATQTDTESGVSGFGAWTFMPEWSVFGRYDWATKHLHQVAATPDMPNDYYNVGIEWNPIKIVDFSLVYKHEDESGNYATSNIGAGATMATKTNYNEVGIFGQLRW